MKHEIPQLAWKYVRRPFTGAWIETLAFPVFRQYPASPLHGGVD